MSSVQQYIDLFRSERALIDAGAPDAVNACRDAAAKALVHHGLPTTRTERYKYCDVEGAFAPNYGLNLRRTVAVDNPYSAYRCAVPNLSTSLHYVLNDTPVIDATQSAPLPEGVEVMTFAEAARRRPECLAAYYHRAAGRDYDGITALNTMLVQDGIFVYLPAQTRLTQPLQLVNISTAAQPLLANRRLLVIAEEGAAGALLLCDHTVGTTDYLTTQVVEVFAAAGASIDLYGVEETSAHNTRFCQCYIEQQENSRVTYNGITLNGGRSRHTMDVRLLGPGASIEANGAVVGDDSQQVDCNLLIDHRAPHCQSDLLYKYVLNGASVGAFAGKVLVRQEAQQTTSQQTNANLCATPTAHAYSQPMLEIYADDVKCNHGSSIGKLDETALFYMRQRGIPAGEARLLLQHAFVNEVLRRVAIDHLRDRLSQLVEQRFRGQLSRCRDCSLCHS